MGYTTTYAKTRISIANNCWGLITATLCAIAVGRFARRKMFMLSAASMFLMFLGFTVCIQNLTRPGKVKSNPAKHAALFFFFAFSPCYNIGNNAITYSTSFPITSDQTSC